MKKFFKKLVSFEPLIVWIRYFLTLNLKFFITNFILPLIICILLGVFRFDIIETINLDIFTFSSIFIGFSISILAILLTSGNKNIEESKNVNLKKTKVSLYEAMIYKFAYIIYNLVFLILFYLILNICNINNSICNLICIFILINALLTIIEATSNTIFTLLKKDNIEK